MPVTKFNFSICTCAHQDPGGLLTSARGKKATAEAHRTHFAPYLSVLLFYLLPIHLSAQNLIIFQEFLETNHIYPVIVRNYFSSISSVSQFYDLDTSDLSHPAVLRFLRSLSINSSFRPTPWGVFRIRVLYDIYKACDHLHDPVLYRTTFLAAFYGFLRRTPF